MQRKFPTAQARRLREEGKKVAALEVSLARVLADFQADRAALTVAFAAERNEAQADLRALRQLAKARGRALHKARCPRSHSLCFAARLVRCENKD